MKILILTTDDLNWGNESLKINDVRHYHFSSLISREEICKASLIIFKKGKKIKILKSKYPIDKEIFEFDEISNIINNQIEKFFCMGDSSPSFRFSPQS